MQTSLKVIIFLFNKHGKVSLNSGVGLTVKGLTEEKAQLGLISPIGYTKSTIRNNTTKMGTSDLFSDSTLPDAEIPN